MRLALIAAAWLVACSALAQAPGSAVKAAQTATRSTTAPVTASGLLLAPSSAGQLENCSAEATVSPSTLRFGILINLFHAPKGCERRRDAWDMAVFGDLDAAKERMCQEAANRRAYAAAGRPCALEVKLQGERP